MPARAIAEAIRGVLKNAQDASPAGAAVDLIVRRTDGAIDFAVADRGPGMPRAVLERVGEPFFTTKPLGRGMGLGLFLARTVVERLGRVAAPRLQRGARHHGDRARAAAGAARVTGARPPLLLVDDDETFRERLGRALRDRGYDVVTASSHATAMEAARARVPAFAVVDLKMPGRRGSSWSRICTSWIAQTRIVVLTGYGNIASAVDALHRGAHDYLSKPADADEIIAALLGHKAAGATASPGARVADPPPSLARAEWEHMSRILADVGGNVSEAARRLGDHAADAAAEAEERSAAALRLIRSLSRPIAQNIQVIAAATSFPLGPAPNTCRR